MTNTRKAVKLATNEAVRAVDAIAQRVQLDWDAYNAAVKRGSTKPWLYL